MHTESVENRDHDHTFGQDRRKPGERRTLVVIVITAITMAVEISAGIAFGSMALLADGLHMASHASALGISALAYYYTRRHARDARFNFGTGKINSLAAFASAVLLAVFSMLMAWESVKRFMSPVSIEFNQAILVAVVGLVVNGVCIVILGGHGHSHEHEDDDGHEAHSHGHQGPAHRDLNLWSAYLHVLADALTSVLAIGALLAGKYFGQGWLDPVMGVVGAVLVMRWSVQLLRISAHVLLDMQAPENVRKAIRGDIETEGDNRISDMHVWSVGPDIYAAEIGVVSSCPKTPAHYRELVLKTIGIVHATVEVHHCAVHGEGDDAT